MRRFALVLAAALALPAPAAATTVVGEGHVDVGPRLIDGDWTVQVRDDTGAQPVWRDPDELVLQLRPAARTRVPRDRAYAFLGAAGSAVWLLPQVQREHLLWPGWNTQDPGVAAAIRREATWTLHGVDGPGRFVLFESGGFGAPEVLFDSGRPLPQQTGIEADTHVHGNWAFTRPGVYRLHVEMAATTRAGRALGDRATLRFVVGRGDPARAFETAGGGGSALAWIVIAAAVATAAAGGWVVVRRRSAAQ